jgi:hypothetical protein
MLSSTSSRILQLQQHKPVLLRLYLPAQLLQAQALLHMTSHAA